MENNVQQTDNIKWWQALNPAIYLISVLPALGVLLIANGSIWLPGLVMATVAVVLLQHAINLFNDVSDWRLGADINKSDSWVRLYNGDTHIINRHGCISMLLGMGLGLFTLYLSDKFWILLFATPMLMLGYLYNAGRRPLSYTVLGEWVTGLCYGPGVFGCLYLLVSPESNMLVVSGMFTFACLAVALLLSHQPPQIEDDKAAGKHSFAVRYGVSKTIATSRYLFAAGMLCFSAGLAQSSDAMTSLSFLVVTLITIAVCFQKTVNPKLLLSMASTVFLSALFIQFSFSI